MGATSAAKAPGIPGLRTDAPGRLPYARGARADLRSTTAQAEAIKDLEEGFYASSTVPSVLARRATICSILAEWGLTPHPISMAAVRAWGLP